MKKAAFCTLVLCFSSLLFCEDASFVEYEELKPDINNLASMYTATKNRRLYFEDGDLFYSWNANDNVLKTLSNEEVYFSADILTERMFFNPHTGNSYWSLIVKHFDDYDTPPIPFNNNWYKLILTNDDKLTFEWSGLLFPEQSFEIHKNLIFKSKMEYIRQEHIMSYSIMTEEGDVIWSSVYEYPVYGGKEIFYISDAWLLIEDSKTLLNYETGEEVSFKPEVVIGYGDGVILTSSFKEEEGYANEFTGITVWTPEKEILYQDKNFLLSEPLLEPLTEEYPWMQGYLSTFRSEIYFARFDYPYIYYQITFIWNKARPHYTIIMNLETGKTYMSPEGFTALAVFEED